MFRPISDQDTLIPSTLHSRTALAGIQVALAIPTVAAAMAGTQTPATYQI